MGRSSQSRWVLLRAEEYMNHSKMLDKTQHTQFPRADWAGASSSGRAAGGLAARPPLIQGRLLATRS